MRGVIPSIIEYEYRYGANWAQRQIRRSSLQGILEMLKNTVKGLPERVKHYGYRSADMRIELCVDEMIAVTICYQDEKGIDVDCGIEYIIYSTGFGEELFDKIIDELPDEDIAVIDNTVNPRRAVAWLWNDDVVTGLNALIDWWKRGE